MKRIQVYVTDEHFRRLNELRDDGIPKSILLRKALEWFFAGDTIEKLREALRVERDITL